MKKMIFALVAMVMMSVSAMAQNDEGQSAKIGRLSRYLELTIKQMEPVKKAMMQFAESQKSVENLKPEQMAEGWSKVLSSHRRTMKKILDGKQYQKYDAMLNNTIKNNTGQHDTQKAE